MAILVTGGAGYIGSVVAELLHERGEQVVVLDNLSRGHRSAVPPGIAFHAGDIGDRRTVATLARDYDLEACLHFAAFAYVDESVSEPALYFENNVQQGIGLIDELRLAGVSRIVFSSSCTTYGEPDRVPITEDHPQRPTNPYGHTKLIIERLLRTYDHAYAMKFVALRYFNAAGGTNKLGEHHDPEPHLIPNVLAVALGLSPYVRVFGSDYPTPDGTAVRDYIHVADLAMAHVLALDYLRNDGASISLNLGNGLGFSVLEVIEAARRVTNCRIESKLEPRREGDPAQLIADASKARSLLGWRPDQSELHNILESAWQWRLAHPKGYDEPKPGASSPSYCGSGLFIIDD
jgi:UDP-glucose 4-epimerase